MLARRASADGKIPTHLASRYFWTAPYLIECGWELRRIHDLGALVAEAVKHDSCFADFEESADNLTDQFWAQHYPGGDLSEIGQDFPELRRSFGEMIEIIEAKLCGPR